MHDHLDIELNARASSGLVTPPTTQSVPVPSTNLSSRPPASTRQSMTTTKNSTAPGPSSHPRVSQHSNIATSQPSAPQQNRLPAVALTILNTAPGMQHPPAARPAAIQPAAAQQQPLPPADEIAALRARIAELEHGEAHGNQPPARAPMNQQALVADPEAVDRIRANLAGAKDDSKCPTLPALHPGHKVSALSLHEYYHATIYCALALVEHSVPLFHRFIYLWAKTHILRPCHCCTDLLP